MSYDKKNTWPRVGVALLAASFSLLAAAQQRPDAGTIIEQQRERLRIPALQVGQEPGERDLGLVEDGVGRLARKSFGLAAAERPSDDGRAPQGGAPVEQGKERIGLARHPAGEDHVAPEDLLV